MAKDPAFLFYPGDWLGGTMGMSFEEKGAYLELLVMQWNCHRITNDNAKKLVGEELWYKVAHKFEADGKGYFNKRLDAEKEKRRKHSEKQSLNAKQRWKHDECDGIANAMPLENENINRDVTIEYKGGAGENWDDIKKKWCQDFRWKEKVCRDFGIGMPETEKQMVEFLKGIDLKEDYKTIPALKSHFVNWYKKHKNGSTANRGVDTGGKKLGTSDARIEALKKW